MRRTEKKPALRMVGMPATRNYVVTVHMYRHIEMGFTGIDSGAQVREGSLTERRGPRSTNVDNRLVS